MTKPFQIYDIICNDGATRMVHGAIIENNHTCWYHSLPCKTVVYILSITSDYSRAGSVECQLELEANNYHKRTGRDNHKIQVPAKPYTTEIPGEPYYTHVYVLKLQAGKWFVGLTSNPEVDIQEHKKGLKYQYLTATFPVIKVQKLVAFKIPLPEHEAVVLAIKLRTQLYADFGYENVKSNIRFIKQDLHPHRYISD